MTCANCSARIERALRALPGVLAASVNLASERAQVEVDLERSTAADVARAVEQAGYTPQFAELRVAVGGMTCANCSARVERALTALPGVLSAQVNLATQRATLRTLAASVAPADVLRAIEHAGYTAQLLDQPGAGDIESRARRQELQERRRATVLAAALTLPLLVLAMGPMLWAAVSQAAMAMTPSWSPWVQWVLATAVAAFPGRRFFRDGAVAFRHAAPDMNSLVMLGVGASWLYSTAVLFFPAGFASSARDYYFESAAVVITAVLLGKYLEALAKGRAGAAIAQLAGLQASTALVAGPGGEQSVPIASIAVGDVVIVKPGATVPVDGAVIAGHSYVDEAMLSGEPLPVARGVGDAVSAGTVNQLGLLQVRAQAVGGATRLAQIIELVQAAQGAKLPIQRLADRIVARFTPAVLLIAALSFVGWLLLAPAPALAPALISAVAVLVVACPCAMGLATPAAVMVGSGRAAQLGVLFRRGEALEALGGVDTIVFDKTGTLTVGRPRVTQICVAAGIEETALLRLAAAADAGSEHPLAQAIVAAARARGLDLPPASDFVALPGLGVRATLDGQAVLLGAGRLLDEQQVDRGALAAQAQALLAQGCTVIHVAVAGRYWGLVGLADALKPDAAAVVSALRARGLRVAMISGDAAGAAQAIAAQAGIDEVMADALPAAKAAALAARQGAGARVAFVGDGINDAPALAQADVGIAVASGTQVAIAAADITLARGELGLLVDAVDMARRTMGVIRANLFWAFIYNALLIPVAAGALVPWWGLRLNPMLAGFAMGMSSVLVLANSLRLRGQGAWTAPALRH